MRCPGVSKQLALYPAVNSAVHTYRGGGAAGPKEQRSVTTLPPCWDHVGTILRSWALLASPAAFVVALGWFLRVLQRSGVDFGASGVDFGGFLKDPGTVFGAPGLNLSALLRACTLVLGKSFQCVKTIVFPRFLQVFHISRAFCAY